MLSFSPEGVAVPKILIMEDDVIQAAMLSTVLAEAGHDVTITHTGTEAWEVLQEESYDVLLTDLNVVNTSDTDRGEGGLSLIAKVRAARRRDDIPWIRRVRIVAISGASFIADNAFKLAYACGADLCLRKPTSAATILNAVEPGKDVERA